MHQLISFLKYPILGTSHLLQTGVYR